MTDLTELASRVEGLQGPDRALMCAAFKAIFPEVSTGAWGAIDEWDAAYDRFCAMLDVGAHESAAMTLVPEGFWSEIGIRGNYGTADLSGHLRGETYSEFATAATPALALTAAALRALSSIQGEG